MNFLPFYVQGHPDGKVRSKSKAGAWMVLTTLAKLHFYTLPLGARNALTQASQCPESSTTDCTILHPKTGFVKACSLRRAGMSECAAVEA